MICAHPFWIMDSYGYEIDIELDRRCYKWEDWEEEKDLDLDLDPRWC